MAGQRERGRTGNTAGGSTRTGTRALGKRAQEVRSHSREHRKCDAGNVTREVDHASSGHGMAWGRMAAKRKRGALAAGKAKRARSAASAGEAVPEGGPRERSVPPQEYSIPPPVSQGKWKNKERVLIFSSRGINFRTRHLMQDLRTLMPHSKADTKMDRKDQLFVINEVCEMKNCNKCIFFEAKKKQDLYMWLSNTPQGPSAKFLVQNVHTLAELKMTGNCLRGSRPLLSFDPIFDQEPHYALLKELFIQIFSTPQYHPKSQPFVDHVFTFTITDERIWFRNYQIIEEDASLVEIGPRFVLNLIKIFQGSFGGPTLYENPHYQSPNMHRRLVRLSVAAKFREKQQVKEVQKIKKKGTKVLVEEDPTEVVFETPAEEKPVEIQLVKPETKPIVKDKKKLRKIQRKKQKKLFRTEGSA
ncbi:ribosome biogenesis protein BRX1 homolog [Corvus cornix cornix]|uniref:ribosome biogenesis protein BRX1 homolog n=1 Tax=Corvus cornix cornix TaxID=932674 RepID=UPI0005348A07|nr:ribosome biogenesis protein BRX1 homolog [Corvus cornix cornix]